MELIKGLRSLQPGVVMGKMNGYELSRNWFNFSFENPDKVKPIHTAVFMWCVEKCNRLGWKEKFGLPTSEAMEAIGVASKNTYLKALNDLIDWGFINLIQKSKNQHQSKVIAISKFDTARGTPLDTALIQHVNGTIYATDTIDKPRTKETNKPINHVFSDFWDSYDKKVGSKKKAEKKWNALSDSEREFIMNHVDDYVKSFDDKKYQPYPTTFLNGKNWESEGFKKQKTDKVKIDMRRFY